MEVVQEELKWTNTKAFKIALSEEVSMAVKTTKSANKLYEQGDYKGAAELYKTALPIWNKSIIAVKQIPEAQVGGWISLANFSLWFLLGNLVVSIVTALQLIRTSSVIRGGITSIQPTPDLQAKLQEAMQTKSFSKQVVVSTLVYMQHFTEMRVKECGNGKLNSAFESHIYNIMNEYMDIITEAIESDQICEDTERSVLEAYIREYTG